MSPSKLRRSAATILFSALALVLSGPVGCLPAAEVPQAPQLQGPTLPASPEIPEFQPPELPEAKAPDAPELPIPPGAGGGNCCIRTGVLLTAKCKGASSCCVKDLDSQGDCEEAKGFWFFEEEGCAGAC